MLFDDEYLVPFASTPIVEVPPLNAKTFVPRNSTALLDAIGQTIDELGVRLNATDEQDRPSKVIASILTDGEENASQKYNWHDVSERIRYQQDKYQWEFLFLGSNQDAIATAGRLNSGAQNAVTYEATNEEGVACCNAFAERTIAVRRLTSGQATLEDVLAQETLLQEMRERARRRKGDKAGEV